MAEQKVKKRGWVKNAAIIFLAVMLVLTFFSNTFMNHSLPEVAAQYVQSGSINAKIRGTGTVAANESYEVKTEQARQVLSVPVKVGDKVSAGDTLVLFTDAESDTMKQAQDALDGLLLAYKKALLNNGSADYSKQQREIEYAQTTLDRAKAKRDAAAYSAADLAQAKQNVTNTQTAVTSAKAKVDAATDAATKAQNYRDELGDLKEGTSGDYSLVTKALNEYNLAKSKRVSLENLYATQLSTLKNTAASRPSGVDETTYIEQLVGKYATSKNSDEVALADAYNAVKAGRDAETAAYNSYTAAQDTYNSAYTPGNSVEWNRRNKLLIAAKADQTNAERAKTLADDAKSDADQKYADLKTAKDNYDSAVTEVETAQKSFEDLMFALADQKKTDGKTAAGAALDLADQRRQISEKQKDIAKLKENGDGTVIKSKVNGIVSSVSVSAGKNAEAGAVLMAVVVPDMGYGIDLSVTKEQAKKLKVGDAAEVTNGGWNEKPMTATLMSIKTDSAKPGTNKLLTFKIEGEDVEAGAQLSLAVGERGGSYDAIVPSSAIRSDSNGSFVLVVVSKSSPLGNRYMAQRVDVKVLASDDTNSAVSGGLTTSDFVITTSNKPIEPGKLVRLPDAAQ